MTYREYIKKLLEIIRGEQVLVGDPKRFLPAPGEDDPGMQAVFKAVSDPHFIASRRHDPFWYIKAQQELESLAIKAGSSLNPDQETIDDIVMEFLEDFLTRVLGMKALEEKLKSKSDVDDSEGEKEDVDVEEMDGEEDGEGYDGSSNEGDKPNECLPNMAEVGADSNLKAPYESGAAEDFPSESDLDKLLDNLFPQENADKENIDSIEKTDDGEEDDTDKSSNNIGADNEPNSNQDFKLPSDDIDFQKEDGNDQDFTVGSGDNKAENRRRENAFLRSIPKELFKLAKLIGRSGSAGFRQSGSFPSATKSDITGITIGDNLSSILPSETALLACPATQTVFFRNLVEKRLQIFASASSGTVPIERQDGPVIICLDTSGSMVGEKVDAACALTMAIAIIAQRRKRDVLIVKYSDWHYLFKVTNMQRDKAGLEMFLSKFEGAGNSENELFRWLFDDIIPKEPKFQSADILCVSDFGWEGLHGDTYRRIEKAKKKGLRFYGLNVMSKEDNNGMFQNYCDDVMNEVCDSLWCYQNGRCWEVGMKRKDKTSKANQEEGKGKQKRRRKIGYI
ncbi:MAG: hypothetical protein MJZ72_09430 [Bacteroidales bacterium]|nr:hypothetical protein [Bacteroidales bacterium]